MPYTPRRTLAIDADGVFGSRTNAFVVTSDASAIVFGSNRRTPALYVAPMR
jgi:hypothetical protein